MSYTMTHILIADKMLEYIAPPVDYPTYIVGAIAPDAVHASPDYTRTMKEKSHLFAKGAVWGRVTKENEFSDWIDSIKKFCLLNYDKYKRDFFLGYIVHILTDVCACRQIYAPFYNSLSKENFDDKMEQYRKENYCVNYYLFCEYSKEKNLLPILQEGNSCPIADVFDDRLLGDRIKQLFDFEFAPHDTKQIAHNEICTIENTRRLIMDAPSMIKHILDEGSGVEDGTQRFKGTADRASYLTSVEGKRCRGSVCQLDERPGCDQISDVDAAR